jgi:hypothetical protein
MPYSDYGHEVIKHGDALELAAAEGFEWDYESADPDALYDALEAIGYWWDDDARRWHGPEE